MQVFLFLSVKKSTLTVRLPRRLNLLAETTTYGIIQGSVSRTQRVSTKEGGWTQN